MKATDAFFMDVLRRFKTHLTQYPTATFGAYCKMMGLNYENVRYWASRKGVSIRSIKKENLNCFKTLPMQMKVIPPSQQTLPFVPQSDAHGFINFIPGQPSLPLSDIGLMRGVSINFPDGVNLTLQECTAADLASLLTIYASRKEALPCLG